MFKIESCNNHTCRLNDACKCYIGKRRSSDNIVYYRPKIFFDEQCKPKIYCEHLIPHNIDFIVKQSKMNIKNPRKTETLIHNIVNEYGSDSNKPKLMKDLKALAYSGK